MNIRTPHPSLAEPLARYFHDNAAHLEPWEPRRPQGYHEVSAWRKRLVDWQSQYESGAGAYFVGMTDDELEVIGTCSLSNVIRGALQACNLGYSVGQRWEGQGFVHTLAHHALEHAFGEMGLHRVMANHMPGNERSARVLQRLGFEREGYARQYLYINGRWEDHVMNALINPSAPHEEH